MPNSVGARFQNAWNAFFNKDPTVFSPNAVYEDYGYSTSYRPDRFRLSRGSERTIVTTVYNRIAMDVASIDIEHVKVDANGRFVENVRSGLNNALTTDANIDQTGRAFIQDVVMSMFDEGCVAIVPVDTTENPERTGSYDILTLRTGRITAWFPKHVRVEVYNENIGRKQEIVLMKQMVGIVENPLYSIMNEPNSTLQRLIRTINRLDAVNEQNASGKLDLIIQLPYIIKTQARQNQAETRRKAIEAQLVNSKLGIAYTDGTERITQLNRPLENNLWTQVKELTSMLYNQLGLTESIFDGTADEKTMINYYSRTVEPILAAITEEMARKFLTKTARTQGQDIKYFRNPFQLVPVNELAEIADKFTRNEIATSNEIRAEIGWRPSDDPGADELRNKNLYGGSYTDTQMMEDQQPEEEQVPFEEEGSPEEEEPVEEELREEEYESLLKDIDDMDSQLDELEALLNQDDEENELKHYASPYYDPVWAHEYYMRNRELKGRKSKLNDEGKEAADYVKSKLDEERKAKIKSHKDQTNAKIKSNSENARARISTNSENTSARIKSNTEAARNTIRQNTLATSNTIKTNAEQLKSTLSQRKDQVKRSIEAHKTAMQSQIDALNDRLKKMTKRQRAHYKDDILAEIATLRDANKAKRDELNAGYKSEAESLRGKHKVQSDNLRNENRERNEGVRSRNSEASNSLRSQNKAKNTAIKEENKTANTKLREEHKKYASDIKAEYENKYLDELEKITSEAGFQKPEKTKSSSSKSSGGSSKRSSSSSSTKKSKKTSSSKTPWYAGRRRLRSSL